MTKEDIIRMAEEAGIEFVRGLYSCVDENLERFANLVAAAEREACAEVCMAVSSDITLLGTAAECVNAIRARGEKK